jgi:hypothetical protein
MVAQITASGDAVLPPYASGTDPISALSRGTYNASDYGAAWTDKPGSVLPTLGGAKRKTRRSKSKKMRRSKSKSYRKKNGRNTRAKK